MTTLAAPNSLGFTPARSAQRRALNASSPVAAASSRGSWIERLADWADRQPVHRRVGSWVLYR
ncbi:hypothetical protein O4H66_20750 [Comamonadaceae bacterium G21597-S1]|nr:hypothetical protein [Comamonadaceae bacterium G21597-S1]